MRLIATTLGRTGWSRRSAILVLLLALGAGAALASLPVLASPFPPPSCVYAVVTYYSDATKTTVVGRCITDGCEGFPTTCTGTKTTFQSLSALRCSCTN